MYHPQVGQLHITGGDIYADGGVGVLMRAGQMTMTGGTITAAGTDSGKVCDSEIISNCYGIHLDYASKSPGSSDLSMSAQISGTSSVHADFNLDALHVSKSPTQNPIKTFEVSGATFSSDPSAYLAENCLCTQDLNGFWTVKKLSDDNAVAQVGNSYYETLADAVAAVANSKYKTGTITLLRDSAGIGIGLFSEDAGIHLTIDFDSHIYTVDEPDGNANQAFHLEEGNTVILKNGTINTTHSAVSMLIQNGCDLTLENMVLDGSSMQQSGTYAMSNSCGTALIQNSTIIAKDGDSALDCCKFASYDAPAVTIEASEIIGAISLSGGKLKMISGEINGHIRTLSGYTTGDCTIFGGYFINDPSAYLATGKTVVESTKSDYNFMVVDATATPAKVVPAALKITIQKNLSAADRAAAVEVSNAIQAAVNVIDENALKIAANKEAYENTISYEDGKAALIADGVPVSETDSVTIVVQPYMDIGIEEVSITDAPQTLTVRIAPRYQTVATTAATPAIPGAIKLDGADRNAVIVGKDSLLSITRPVSVMIPLPTGFSTDNLLVRHIRDGHFVTSHPAVISGDSNKVVTFLNDKGLSASTAFILQADSRTATVNFDGTIKTYVFSDVGESLPVLTPPDGMIFGGWRFAGLSGTHTVLTDTLLSALAAEGDDLIHAIPYFYIPDPSDDNSAIEDYLVRADSGTNGSVFASRKWVSKGELIVITVKPNKGYELDKLFVTDMNGNEIRVKATEDCRYTFKMPASNVTIEAVFTQLLAKDLPFADVPFDSYHYDAVAWAVNNGITSGVTGDLFQLLYPCPGGDFPVARRRLPHAVERCKSFYGCDTRYVLL